MLYFYHMRLRRSGGYTLLEVMIFLAISSLLLAFSIVAVQGQAAKTEFRTSVDNVNGKIQQWIDQVQNGFTNSSSGPTSSQAAFNCTSTNIGGVSYPNLQTSGATNQRGANPDCVFLGDAILFNNQNADSNHIFNIPIVGLRLSNSGSGELASSLADASPVPALTTSQIGGNSLSGVDLSETYTIPNGTRVAWAGDNSTCGASTTNSCNYLGGFFINLSSGSSQGSGAQSLITVRYPFYHNDNNPSSPVVAQCLMLQPGSSNDNCTPALSGPLNDWRICMVSTRNSDWATLTVGSSNGFGASTSIVYGRGNPVCP